MNVIYSLIARPPVSNRKEGILIMVNLQIIMAEIPCKEKTMSEKLSGLMLRDE